MNKELEKKMINPSYFTDRALQVGFDINSDSLLFNHSNSKLFSEPSFSEFGIEFRYLHKILKEMANNYARLINQYFFEYQTVFPA